MPKTMSKPFLFAVAFAIVTAISVPDAKALLYQYSSSPSLFITDTTPVSDTINVGDSFIIDSMTVWLDIEHTWVGDLFISLEGPTTSTVTLMDQPGVPGSTFGNSDDLIGIYTFDDTAGVIIPETQVVSPIPTGSYILDFTTGDTLAASYNGSDPNGLWTISITDNAGGDDGTLFEWGVDIHSTEPIPEPTTMLLIGTGLAGLAGVRLRRKK